MRRITGRMRIMVALIALLVTSARLITPPAFATPSAAPAIEQVHTTDGGTGLGPKRLPRWPGGSRSPRVR